MECYSKKVSFHFVSFEPLRVCVSLFLPFSSTFSLLEIVGHLLFFSKFGSLRGLVPTQLRQNCSKISLMAFEEVPEKRSHDLVYFLASSLRILAIIFSNGFNGLKSKDWLNHLAI